MSVFSKRVKSIRKQSGLTQEQFAKLIGVKLATLRSWEIARYEPDYRQVLLTGMATLTEEYLVKQNREK